jgi:hypothetical protein
LTSIYRSGPSKTWIKVKNPKAPAATRQLMASFSSRERRGLPIKREAGGQLFDFAFSERFSRNQ